MVIIQSIIMVVLILMATGVRAEVFYKANPTTPPAEKESLRDEVDCQKSKSKGCQGTSKPTKFMAFGDCKVITTSNGRGVLIPARTKREWSNFMAWAAQHPDVVTVDSCNDPQWTDWSMCSNACGKGVRTRRCNRPPLSDGSSGCKGLAQQTCMEYSGCVCPELEKTAVFCEGQDRNFTDIPPKVSYVDFEMCDHHTKCQARCPRDHAVVDDGSGCAP